VLSYKDRWADLLFRIGTLLKRYIGGFLIARVESLYTKVVRIFREKISMLRHRDKARTYFHNIRLAALLSIVAGVVNIVGLLSFYTLTTNVTGHFAYFSERLFLENYTLAFTSVLYVLFFFMGAFLTNTAIELTSKNKSYFSYILPISLEIMCLTVVAFSSLLLPGTSLPLGCLLLLAMGMQNALVTKISNSVVRTTHLTGLFTDMGIELSQLLFYKKNSKRSQLKRNILLKLIIVSGFFLGGVTGALFHKAYQLQTLLIPVGILLLALYYNRIRLNYFQLRRKIKKVSQKRGWRRANNHG